MMILFFYLFFKVFQEMSEFSRKSSIFEDPLSYYNHMAKEMQNKVVNSLTNQVKVKIFSYGNMK